MKRSALITLFLLAGAAHAQPPQDQQPRRGPPQEFVDACKGKQAGDVVEAKSPHGDVLKGVCQLVMAPSHGPAGQDKMKRPAR